MRKLTIIPIIHTLADMGSIAEQVKAKTIAKIGLAGWKRQKREIELFWSRLSDRLLSFPPPDFVYNDGLPAADGKLEYRIVKELAEQGSNNHILVQTLIDRGSKLVGTESPELLIEEYERVKSSLEDPCNRLLDKRDKFMAERINGTLLEGCSGIVFVGLLHEIEWYLAEDIEVTHWKH